MIWYNELCKRQFLKVYPILILKLNEMSIMNKIVFGNSESFSFPFAFIIMLTDENARMVCTWNKHLKSYHDKNCTWDIGDLKLISWPLEKIRYFSAFSSE